MKTEAGSPGPSPAAGVAAPAPSRTAILIAFATLYVLWGSTYLAIRVAVVSWPPFVMAAARFALAGGGLYAVLRARGAPRPSARNWGAAALVGALLLAAGNGLVCWAEQWVPSGETALIIATVPLWMTVLPWLARRAPAPRPAALVGVAVGLGGVATLMGGLAGARCAGSASGVTAGRIALLAASFSWSLGSLGSRRLPLPEQPFLATAMEMLTACPLLAAAALASGEWGRFHLSAVTSSGWLALSYLIVFGSIAGFGSYVFLLKHTSASRASTYAFVNPLVAVALGAVVAGEQVGPRTVVAALLIVVAVGAVILGELGLAPGAEGPILRPVRGKPAGVRIIIGYKITKAILQVAAAVVLIYGAKHGLATALADFAEKLREHAVHAWSNIVAAALLRFTHERHGLWLAAVALLGDAVLSSLEGWALWRGYAWGSWLIVAATACLLPFEIRALARHIRVGRVILFLVNVTIVAYLLRRVEGERLEARARREARPD